jgi:hypothetical protein
MLLLFENVLEFAFELESLFQNIGDPTIIRTKTYISNDLKLNKLSVICLHYLMQTSNFFQVLHLPSSFSLSIITRSLSTLYKVKLRE